ncbi:hypothetical protein N7520_011037 [Penicillium odoratum]|uniref:uncharacterized protein n=1 Tax=Penicillium odoratum TaxID=1167516 RepID=UPI0025468B4E|nr:uncharacterized protein N7520_011037 [Penicillium odoratum]KAJ5745855.1 hypothetical protein N7520_011037 [Penicillium odoratum]
MNARRGVNILSTGPIHYASPNSHHETALTSLQNHEILAYIILAIISIYLFLDHFGFVPVSLIRIAWNILVFATPSWIIVALDTRMSPSETSPSSPSQMTFQAKNEAMQRFFGLENSSFTFFSRTRSLSGLGNALLGNSNDTIPPGLGNWDNSCYQNSIIQGLASLKSLATFLERNVDSLGKKGTLSTHEALKGIIDDLNSASNYGHKLWIPSDLKSMSSWQQQDAQEYFSKLVDQIDIEVHRASRGQTRNMGLKMVGREENIMKDIRANTDSDGNVEETSLRNPLEGLLAQRVGCMKCGWAEGLSLIPFNCLTVPLGGRDEYDLRECLEQYMTLELIEGVECAKCTLLRAQHQLKSLLGDMTDANGSPDSLQTPGLSDAMKTSFQERLKSVQAALEEDDFAEKTLINKCNIPSKNRVSTTKSRQAVIARAPQCLAVHINRSLFDEMTGMLKKNYAAVKFPRHMDLNKWCLGTQSGEPDDRVEQWVTNPSESMLPSPGQAISLSSRHYELRAIITHYGRHENGHYICYRKYPTATFPASVPDEVLQSEGDKDKLERWYRLSDDDVQMVSEGHVMSQGGAFMLFYEAVEDPLPAQHEPEPPTPESMPYETTESVSNFTLSENMSVTTTITDDGSNTSRATSVSTPDYISLHTEDPKQTVPPLRASSTQDLRPEDAAENLASPSMITAS